MANNQHPPNDPAAQPDRATALNERKSHLRALAVAGTLAATGLFTAFAASVSDGDSADQPAKAASSGVAEPATVVGDLDSEDATQAATDQDDAPEWSGRSRHHHDFDSDGTQAGGFSTPQGEYFSQTPDGSVTPGQQSQGSAPSMSGGS